MCRDMTQWMCNITNEIRYSTIWKKGKYSLFTNFASCATLFPGLCLLSDFAPYTTCIPRKSCHLMIFGKKLVASLAYDQPMSSETPMSKLYCRNVLCACKYTWILDTLLSLIWYFQDDFYLIFFLPPSVIRVVVVVYEVAVR